MIARTRTKLEVWTASRRLDGRWRSAGAQEADDREHAEHDDGDQPVPADSIGGGLAGVVGEQADAGRPDDAAGRVEGEEAPPLHVADAGHPRSRHPQDRDEAAEEDRLAAMLLEEALGGGQRPFRIARDRTPPLEQPAPAVAPERVADVVADDRRCGGHHDHGHDREVMLVARPREKRGDDQARLPGQRHACGFDRDQQEEQREPVVDELVGHVVTVRASVGAASASAGECDSVVA